FLLPQNGSGIERLRIATIFPGCWTRKEKLFRRNLKPTQSQDSRPFAKRRAKGRRKTSAHSTHTFRLQFSLWTIFRSRHSARSGLPNILRHLAKTSASHRIPTNCLHAYC